MTAPAQQPAQQQPHAAHEPPADTGLVAMVAEVLLVGAALSLSAAAIVKTCRMFGVTLPLRAVELALGLVSRGTNHEPRMRGTADVTREQRKVEARYRAAYVISAAKRIAASLTAGKSARDALRAERAYWAAHERARKSRMAAAVDVAEMADIYGPLLGWHTVLDGHATPECVAADGHNFSAFTPPRIGWPGMPHGGTCRCYAGRPFPYAATVDEATAHMLPRLGSISRSA